MGIALSALFALWFGSGLFMIYVEFPQLTRPERIAAAPGLNFRSANLSPAEAIARLNSAAFTRFGSPSAVAIKPAERVWMAQCVRLVMLEDRPAYQIYPDNGAQPAVVFADTGEMLHGVAPEVAVAAVNRHTDSGNARYIEMLVTDQWTVSSSLNPHRPLLRIALDDAEGSEFYVSSTTGEVVRDSSRRERILNYFAAVVHWIYPTVLRRYPEAWAWTVNVLSAAGTALALSGLWVGVLRVGRRPLAPRSARQRLIRWHYLTGAIFGIVTLTWVFSGWMSMNPGGLNSPRTPTAKEAQALSGGPLAIEGFIFCPGFALSAGAVEAELLRYDGQPFYLVTSRSGAPNLVSAAAPESEPLRKPSADTLIARAGSLMPKSQIASATVLTGYDNYYYTRHPGSGEKPLPVVRIVFKDTEHTWFHLDPATGQVLERSTARNRLFRHLYNGLHSFDWWWLWSRRPLWDAVVISFCLGGLSLSVLGVALGLRRFRTALDSLRRNHSLAVAQPTICRFARTKDSASS